MVSKQDKDQEMHEETHQSKNAESERQGKIFIAKKKKKKKKEKKLLAQCTPYQLIYTQRKKWENIKSVCHCPWD